MPVTSADTENSLPLPNLLGIFEAYFVCYISPIFQIHIFDLCLHWVSVVCATTHCTNSQNSIISFGDVDFHAKIFLIFVSPNFNSITNIGMMYLLLLLKLLKKSLVSACVHKIIVRNHYKSTL